MRNLFVIFVLIFSFSATAQIEDYNEALQMIINSSEYKIYTTNPRKYKVSDELIVFSKMGKMFKNELAEIGLELSDYDIVINEKKSNKTDKSLLSLNKKKCSKLKIYFTEQQQGVFFVELIKGKQRNVKYDERIHFGVSYMFMFRVNQDKVELLSKKEINYN